jgi:hypothetical protein
MAVIAALDNPLAIFLTDDFTDVVSPHDDSTYGRSASA